MKSCALASVAYPLAMLSLFSLGVPAAGADTYPVRPVKIITPGSPGTGADVIIRIVAEGLSRRWGHQVYVENKPGGFGQLAAQAAAASEADGYTLYQAVAATFVSVPQMQERPARGRRPRIHAGRICQRAADDDRRGLFFGNNDAARVDRAGEKTAR